VRFAQAAIVVVAVQGVSDVVVLPRLGALFRHERYVHFSIDEWASISLKEMVMVLRHVSKQATNANVVLTFLQHFKDTRHLPRTLAAYQCHYGIGKKSACLLMGAVGMANVGIPVDRHLLSGFRSLGWIPTNIGSETVASELVEKWLPREKWETCNIVLAGIRQLWNNNTYKPLVIEVAEELGREHIYTARRLCNNGDDAN
jgi:endonuclease III